MSVEISEFFEFKNSPNILKFGNFISDTTPSLSEKQKEFRRAVNDIASWKAYALSPADKTINEINCRPDLDLEIFFEIKNEQNQNQLVSGKIKIMVDKTKLPPFDVNRNNVNRSQERANRWAEMFGIFEDSPYFLKMKRNALPLVCSVVVPGILLAEMEAYVLSVFLMMIFDDTFDNVKDFKKSSFTVSDIRSAVNHFGSILKGIEIQDLPKISKFPNFHAICSLLKELRRRMSEYGVEKFDYFIESYYDYIQACAWESSSHSIDVDGLKYVKDLYFDIREYTIGLVPCVEFQAAIRGIIISEKVRRDPLIFLFNMQVAKQVTLVNDLFSYKKEIENNEVWNYILIQTQKKSVEDGFRKTFEKTDQCIQSLIKIERSLLKKHPGEKQLKDYLLIGRIWVDGNLQWSILNDRYGYHHFDVHMNPS